MKIIQILPTGRTPEPFPQKLCTFTDFVRCSAFPLTFSGNYGTIKVTV